jgi:BCD family chlorophyll transporter-like MFS transporter
MSAFRKFALNRLSQISARYLPFADVATEDLPLSRLLRLSLFQVSVGMALVLVIGTLNRVMIVELKVPATLVGVMLALPVLFAPFRMLIGYRSDTHASALGLRRIPFIWKGTLLQFGGFAIMPFALLVLSGFGKAAEAPMWIGQAAAALAFLLVGAGIHMVQTVGLALATDLVPEEDHPRIVGLMYVMLLVGMIVSSIVYGLMLEDYNPLRLVQVVQGTAVLTVLLNCIALWKQEGRRRDRAVRDPATPSFGQAWRDFAQTDGALRLLVVIGLGTAGFGMADLVLEPYGGQVLGMTVSQTTRLTAVLAAGGLVGFALAWRVIGRGADPLRIAGYGALAGLPAFAAILLSAQVQSTALFVLASLLVGFGGGLFSHGTLTGTKRRAPRSQIGLALGAWGAVQATSAGVAVMLGGVIRDAMMGLAGGAEQAPALAYLPVFALEMVLLALALAITLPLMKNRSRQEAAAA